MIAVIATGGKQYLVKAGDRIKVEKLETAEGKQHVFDNILLVSESDGQKLAIGEPQVKGAKVTATVLKQGRADKVTIIKYKSKIRYRRKIGHRQPFTELKIDSIAA